MKRATFNILFFIKWKKLLKNGDAPIYMRITVNKRISEISIKRGIEPHLWDSERAKAKGNNPKSNEINDYLNSIRGQIYTYQREFQEAGKTITSKLLTNAFQGIGEKQWTLLELFEDHNKQMEQLVNKDYSPLTLQRFNAALNHIKTYLENYYNNTHLPLSEVNHKFITQFEHYLKSIANCQHNSAMKHVKALKKIIRIGIANGYLKQDPFANYKISVKQVERDVLTRAELEVLQEKEISIERLDKIRDLFIFQCYTGLAYRDLNELTPEDIQIGIDGNKWIMKKRAKTGITFRVPIFPIAERILKKYQNDPCRQIEKKLLPVPSNQKMNGYLKELATMCQINKELHTHLARHTYATTVTLSNGVPLETVSKLLGHTKIQTTQIYAKIVDSKLRDDMEALRQKLG